MVKKGTSVKYGTGSSGGTALATAPKSATGKAVKTAAPITWGMTIEGICSAAGFDHAKLAAKLGVVPSTLSNWISGTRTPRGEPKTKLLAFAKRYGLDVPAGT